MDDIRTRRLGWADHFVRMEDERISQKFLNVKFRKIRPRGKPRTRRKDVIGRETSKTLGIRGWRRRAEDREEWRRLVMTSGPRRGCSVIDDCNGMEFSTETRDGDEH